MATPKVIGYRGGLSDNKENGMPDHQFSIPSSESHQHPLLRGTARLADIDNDFLEAQVGVTRPSLDRALDAHIIHPGLNAENDKSLESPSGSDGPGEEGKQLLVLVHQVSPKDSLAGVALRYGISIAELRRANQLWFSDSIHLRKTLYVPVDKATQSTSKQVLIDLTTDIPSSTSTHPSPVDNIQSHNAPIAPDENKYGTIRRIPASQLSFFPPASRKPSPNKISKPPLTGHPSHSSTTTTTSPSQFPALSSILSAAVARISLDSVSSDDQEHELRDIRDIRDVGRPGHRRHFSEWTHSRNVTRPQSTRNENFSFTPSRNVSHLRTRIGTIAQSWTPKADRTKVELDTLFTSLNTPEPFSPSLHHPKTSNTSPITPQQAIRTVQLEPSPDMKVPTVPKLQDKLSRDQTIGAWEWRKRDGIPVGNQWEIDSETDGGSATSDDILI